jgi:hypothetical protein
MRRGNEGVLVVLSAQATDYETSDPTTWYARAYENLGLDDAVFGWNEMRNNGPWGSQGRALRRAEP